MLSFRARALGAAVLIAAAAACVMAAPAGADATKPYSVVISPGTITQGVTVPFQAKITNLTTSQTLGSANLTAPTAFSLVQNGASVTGPGTATVSGNLVQLRNLAVAPGGSVTATINLTVPSTTPCAASYTWLIAAKQSNDFNGTGNDFGPLSNSSLTTAVSCFGVAPPCTGSSCSASVTDQDPASGATLTVTVKPPNAGLLTINVDSDTINCAGYDELLPHSFSVDFLPDPGTTGGTKIVTLNIPKTLMQASVNNGVSFVNICFGADFDFQVKPGTPDPQFPDPVNNPAFRVGLLPDCDATHGAPCVSARKGAGGGAQIEVQAPGGNQDPRYGG